MEKRQICQNNDCNENAILLAWGKWVCGKCYSYKNKELNNKVWN